MWWFDITQVWAQYITHKVILYLNLIILICPTQIQFLCNETIITSWLRVSISVKFPESFIFAAILSIALAAAAASRSCRYSWIWLSLRSTQFSSGLNSLLNVSDIRLSSFFISFPSSMSPDSIKTWSSCLKVMSAFAMLTPSRENSVNRGSQMFSQTWVRVTETGAEHGCLADTKDAAPFTQEDRIRVLWCSLYILQAIFRTFRLGLYQRTWGGPVFPSFPSASKDWTRTSLFRLVFFRSAVCCFSSVDISGTVWTRSTLPKKTAHKKNPHN